MKPSFSDMGKLSAAARRLPEHEKLKAEAIRMHVELDYGINAISPRIGINKISIRRWLIAAGCYRAGHRTTRNKNDGAKLIDCSPTDLGRKQIYVHVWQRRAWLDEWKGVARWDEAKHWHRHPAKQNYINVRNAKAARAMRNRRGDSVARLIGVNDGKNYPNNGRNHEQANQQNAESESNLHQLGEDVS
jgi:transposase-like protein